MININAGNLWTDEYLNKVIALNALHRDDSIQITSLYGSISKLSPTARSFDRIPFVGEDDLERYISRAQFHNINIRYTLNASCLGSLQDFKAEWDKNLKSVILHLHDIGIHEWVVTSPLLIELLFSLFPTDLIEVSTIDEISTVNELRRFKELGANAANVSIMVNRDFDKLTEMNKILPVTLLANEFCIFKCAWRRDCYNQSSHNSLRAEQYFNHYPYSRCNDLRLKDPSEWLRARFILPQWLDYYAETCNITHFKLTGRTHPIEVMLPILESYMSKEYDGNLLSLWPTISHLGNTAEPADSTYISCNTLEAIDFIGNFIDNSCDEKLCGVTCKYCKQVYDKTKGARS